MTSPEQLSFPGIDPEEAARRKAAVAARLLELALNEMYPDEEEA
jgi:hypothetical protein